MGKAKDLLKEFIVNIPSSKLTGFPNKAPQPSIQIQTIAWIYNRSAKLHAKWRKREKGKTVKVTEVVGYKYNLQIQANNQLSTTSTRKLAPRTVAGPVLIDVYNDGRYSLDAEGVRAALVKETLL
ncbi:hypothetical protein M422DRAFT_244686 [Sphaerobolus stellatus SS14]|nr:hypothetical protein M422DRAFT_244686 [Sphaerobolus stellatus SS14]